MRRSKPRAPGSNNDSLIAIIDLPHLPPLDEGYWTAKEGMVSTEQHVLKMIWFDVAVCHPHRYVLTIMSTFGFDTGREYACDRKKNEATNLLLNSNQNKNVILGAWVILNEKPLDPQGIALKYLVVVLSCSAILCCA